VSGTTYYQTQLFDVVKSILAIPITDDDLYDELDALRKANYQATGTATAGAASTLTDTKRKEEDSFWKGGLIEILTGTGLGQKRDVTAWAQATGIFTVTSSWTTIPDTTSKYLVVRSFTKKIQAAFETLQDMIYNKGKRHELILESSQITKPLTYLAIHMICLDLMDEEGDRWDRLAKIYQDKFDKAFNAMHLEYDADESGFIDESEQSKSPTEIRVGRA
jgi:hypothetical protein